MKEFEQKVLDQAYDLFELEEHCSDAELKGAGGRVEVPPGQGGDFGRKLKS